MARMTYMGNCVLDGVILGCTSMNSAIENNVQFYDHVVGLRDTNYVGNKSKGPLVDNDAGGGYKTIQKKIYRYSPSIFKGKLGGPVAIDETTNKINIYNIIEKTIKGITFPTIDFIYIGGLTGFADFQGHRALGSVVESLTINIATGDVASFDCSIVSKKPETNPVFTTQQLPCTKLITWDKCEITSNLTGDVQAFSITIKNTVIPIYVSGNELVIDNYYRPTELRLGMQEVTGTVSTYGYNVWGTTDVLKFKLGNDEWSLNIVYNPTQSAGSGSNEPYVSSTPFVGVSDSAVWISP